MKLAFDQERRLLLLFGPDTFPQRELLRRMYGKFNRDTSSWEFCATPRMVDALTTQFRGQIETDQSVNRELTRQMEVQHLLETGVDGLPFEPKTHPYKHQVVGATYLTMSHGALLLDDMGLGKTKQVIDAISILRARKVVVICPNSIKCNWADQIAKHGWQGYSFMTPGGPTAIRKGLVSAWGKMDYEDPSFLILNYESLRFFPDEFLAACRGSVLVADEVHRLKDPRAKVTKIVQQARPLRFWGLTGTPIANRPEDAFSLVNLARPGRLFFRWFDFDKRYVKRNPFGGISGYRNLQEIADALSDVGLGRKKEDCLDLPERIYQRRVVELSHEERRAYEKMELEFLASYDEKDVETKAPTYAVRFLRFRQLASGLVSESQGGPSAWSKALTKIKEVRKIWDDSGRKRMVVWFQFVPVGRKICEQFCEDGVTPPFFIDGSVDVTDRHSHVNLWSKTQDGVLVAQMDTMGQGVDLQAADLQVFVDMPLTPLQRRQCVDRLHRIGQTRPVTIVDVIAADTIDEDVEKMLGKKISMADDVEAPSFAKDVISRMKRKEGMTWQSSSNGT
jgi:SNF2 family DNA or RNA helicase